MLPSDPMESSRIVLFYEKCRLCLEKPGIRDIFTEGTDEDNKERLDLSQAIYTCTGVKVSRKDNLPSKLCKDCLAIVIKANELRILAQKNESHLRSLFTSSDDENEGMNNENQQTTEPLLSCTSCLERLVQSSNLQQEHVNNKIISPMKRKNRSLSVKNVIEKETKEKHKEISIRKDLFESTTVSSSTSEERKESVNTSTKKIRIKEEDGNEYICGMCSKHFETWKKLYLHQRTHNRNNMCPLDACGKKFATKGDLEKHLRTHTGVKPFVCDICDKSFAQQGTLKSHKESVHYIFTYS